MMKNNKEKRNLKREPSFKVNLNEEQKEAKGKVFEYDVNFIHGDFGSGKTLLACQVALYLFRKKQINKIIIARPKTKDAVGFLPGDVKEKFEYLVKPIIHNFNMCQAASSTQKMMDNGDIEILPVDFAKGITYVDSFVIVDEYQDMMYDDFRLMVSRLGKDSKIAFIGSKEQIHKSIGKRSCIHKTMKLEYSGLVGYTTLKANHRNSAIMDILNYLEDEE